MKLFDDLRFIGTNERLSMFGNSVWHCTSSAIKFGTSERLFIVQRPHMHKGEQIGYTGFDQVVLTEDELVTNFSKVKEDGSLEPLVHSRDNKELQEELKKIDDYFENMSDEELLNILDSGQPNA